MEKLIREIANRLFAPVLRGREINPPGLVRIEHTYMMDRAEYIFRATFSDDLVQSVAVPLVEVERLGREVDCFSILYRQYDLMCRGVREHHAHNIVNDALHRMSSELSPSPGSDARIAEFRHLTETMLAQAQHAVDRPIFLAAEGPADIPGIRPITRRDLTATEVLARQQAAVYGVSPAMSGMLDMRALLRSMMREMGLPDNFLAGFAERSADVKAASKRAKELLISWLSPEQKQQYEAHGYFDVIGSSGNRYRIEEGRQQNVYRLGHSGHRREGYCFLPSGGLAYGDCMLAQKLALESDEPGALAVAHRFGG